MQGRNSSGSGSGRIVDEPHLPGGVDELDIGSAGRALRRWTAGSANSTMRAGNGGERGSKGLAMAKSRGQSTDLANHLWFRCDLAPLPHIRRSHDESTSGKQWKERTSRSLVRTQDRR